MSGHALTPRPPLPTAAGEGEIRRGNFGGGRRTGAVGGFEVRRGLGVRRIEAQDGSTMLAHGGPIGSREGFVHLIEQSIDPALDSFTRHRTT